MKTKCRNCRRELLEHENTICESCIDGLRAKYKTEETFHEALERIIDYKP